MMEIFGSAGSNGVDDAMREETNMKTKGVIVDKDMDGAIPVEIEIRCKGDEVGIEFGGKRGFELRLKRDDLLVALVSEEHG